MSAIGEYDLGGGYTATLRPVTRAEGHRFAPHTHVVTLWQARRHHPARKVAWDVTPNPDRWQATADRLHAQAV